MQNKKNKEKVVVTGGAGFIGSHVSKKLVEAGYDVYIIDSLLAGKKENLPVNVKFFKLDVRNLQDIKPIFEGAKYVFHFAAIPSVQFSIENPEETNDVNIGGTLNVLTAAKDASVKRVVYSASSSVYGDANKLPITENEKASPKSPYALQKYVGELYCKMFSEIYGLETVCLRYFNVYGQRQPSKGAYASVLAKFLDLKKQDKKLTIVGDGNQTRDFVNVSDVADANILAALSERVGKGESINIGTGKKYSVNEIAKIIGGQTEFLPPRIEPKNSLADISLAKFLLGWKPKIDLEKGLKNLLQNN
jgi:nucleoside-diphosphate-sugar epimerase